MAKGFDQRAELAQQRAKQARRVQTVAIAATLLVVVCIALFVLAKRPIVEFEDGAEDTYHLSVQSGLVFTVLGRIIGFDNLARIDVVAPGYITQTIDLQSASQAKYIEVFMPLAPVVFQVASSVALDSPSWFVDEQWLSSEASLNTELKPGTYSLKLSSAFTNDLVQQVELLKAQPNTLQVSPSLVEGRLSVKSSPSGAEVWIDNERQGVTPLDLDLSGGRYEVALRKDQHTSQHEIIEISAASPQVERDYRLRVGTNGVRLALTPAGGTLLVNGRPHPANKDVEVPKTATVNVSYQKPGYSTKAIELQPSDRSAAISLSPAYGEILIESSVPAQVFIDNQDKGSTPLKLSLQTLSYDVSLKKPGFVDERQRVTVKANQTIKVSFAMVTSKDALLSKNPPRVINSIGMSLLQFLPNEFVMGAPRAERGQRAHEIQRKVGFDRHIYVSTHEVSEAAYALFKGQSSKAKTPARNVSWDDAAQFCNWLSLREGLLPVYAVRNGRVVDADLTKTGYRLPTEAEWEWLAKAAGKTLATVFVWGNQYQIPKGSGNLADISAKGKADVFLSDYSDGFAELAPIGSFDAERSGLFDMVGNVSEWVHDSYSRTPADQTVIYLNYAGPSSMGGEHVIKGSNYLSESWTELRAAMRQAFREGNDTTGFRVARYVY